MTARGEQSNLSVNICSHLDSYLHVSRGAQIESHYQFPPLPNSGFMGEIPSLCSSNDSFLKAAVAAAQGPDLLS